MTKTKSIQIRIAKTKRKGGWRAAGDSFVSLALFLGISGMFFSMFSFTPLLPVLFLSGAVVILIGQATADAAYLRIVLRVIFVLWLVVFAVVASSQLLAGAALGINQISDGIGEAFSRIFPRITSPDTGDTALMQMYALAPVGMLLGAGSVYLTRSCNVPLALLLFFALKLLQAVSGLASDACWELLTGFGIAALLYRCYFDLPTTRGRKGGKAVCAMVLVVAVLSAVLLALLPQRIREKPQVLQDVARTAKKTIHELRYGKKQADSLPEGDFTDLGAFSRDDTTVLKVTMSHPDSLYLRGYVGSVYNGNGWEGPDKEQLYGYANRFYWLHANGFYGQLQLSEAALAVDDTLGNDVLNEITVENVGTDRAYIYTPYELCNASGDLVDANGIGDIAPTATGLSGQAIYTYTALPNQVKRCTTLAADLYEQENRDETADTYLIHESQYNTYVYNMYLQLPDDVRELLEARLGSYESEGVHASYPYAKQQILDYLTQQTTYSEDPAGDRKVTTDFLQYFLENSGEGYSVHYATAATLMFRYYGIPARYVEGYLITPDDVKDAADDTTVYVTGMRAHAWAEIYRDGVGWIPFEVTPPYLGIMEQAEELSAYQTAQNPKEEPETETEHTGGDQYEENVDDHMPDYTDQIRRVAVVLLLTLLIAVLLYVLLRFYIRRRRLKKRLAIFTSDAVPDAVQALFRYAMELLAVLGLKRGTGSLYQCRDQVEALCGAEIADAYSAAVTAFGEASYSTHPMTEEQREELQRFVRAVLECLQAKSGRIRRMKYRFWDGLY